MDIRELEALALATVRRKVAEFTTDRAIGDEMALQMSNAVTYDFARMKNCIHHLLSADAGTEKAARWTRVMSSFGYDADGTLPDAETYWPDGLSSRLTALLEANKS